MQKINYKTFSKRRWWERNKGKYIKFKYKNRNEFTWAEIKSITTDLITDDKSERYYRRWNWNVTICIYTIEGDIHPMRLRYNEIDTLKILDESETIIFKLEWEIDWGK